MGWETRRGKRYYYRTRRVRGRVVRQYFGCGPEAEEAARQDAATQAQKMRKLHALVELEREVADLFAVDDHMVALFDAAMTAAGYHRYRGVWRKKRKPKEEAQPVEGTSGGT
jgi:hypothetical protein